VPVLSKLGETTEVWELLLGREELEMKEYIDEETTFYFHQTDLPRNNKKQQGLMIVE